MKRNEKYDEILFGEKFYDPAEMHLLLYQQRCINAMNKYNKTPATPLGLLLRIRRLKKMFGAIGENSYVEPPIHANFGGKNTFIGKCFYANFNLTLVDDGKITIGDNVMIGPNVTIVTAEHSLKEEERLKKENQINHPVTIGNNVWIASGVTIFPGVTIGDGSVIGAGSIVTKDVPTGVLAYGVPCRVQRNLNE